MNEFEIEQALQSLTIIVDSLEKDTPQAARRLKSFGLPYVRHRLNFGDYSAFVTIGSETISLERKCVIERKYDLSELAMCYCQGRQRFTNEFERAKQAGAKIYLLVENGSFEKVLAGDYRSQMNPTALIASITAWLARYNCQIIFCEQGTTPRLIAEILKREMKEYLKGFDVDG